MKRLKCVLLIDDDEATNYFNKLILEKADITNYIHICENGAIALDYLKSTKGVDGQGEGHPAPELIFLDINMPKMNGFEFLEAYKFLDPTQKSKILIVMLTSSMNPDDEARAAKYTEITGFRHKPLSVESVKEIMNNYFN